MKQQIFNKEIIPNKLICNSNLYDIAITDSKFIIEKFCVFIDDDDKIEDVKILKGLHPNCDLKTKFLCIPEHLKKCELNDVSAKIIFNVLEIFNFDSSFYQPWDSFEYVYAKEERIMSNG